MHSSFFSPLSRRGVEYTTAASLSKKKLDANPLSFLPVDKQKKSPVKATLLESLNHFDDDEETGTHT